MQCAFSLFAQKPAATQVPAATQKTVGFHSSDNAETAQQGNSGVYAYKRACTGYNLYYLIDFDDGYVYYMADRDLTCDKVRITSGTLNDCVIITYHDGDSTWQEGLHFKWVNRTETLIWQDHYGSEYEYRSTDLDDVLKLKDTCTIHKY